MDLKKLSSILVDIAVYLEQEQVDEVSSLLKIIYEEEKRADEEDKRRRLVELMKKVTGDSYNVYVTRYNQPAWSKDGEFDSKGLYDICLVVKTSNTLPFRCSTDSVIQHSNENNNEGYIVQQLDLDTIRKFLIALYIYDRAVVDRKKNGECKDVISNDQTLEYLQYSMEGNFNTVQSGVRPYKSVVSVWEASVCNMLNSLNLDEYKNINSFSEALDIVYKNKFVGSTLKLIK